MISRGWTEKEKVARRRRAQEDQIEDTKDKEVTWSEAVKNVKEFVMCVQQVPESIFVAQVRSKLE